MRLTGLSGRAAARRAGVGARTLVRWEQSDFWHDACEEASRRWLNHLTDGARETLAKAIQAGDATSARWLLERVDERLAPPKLQAELTGRGGGPIEVREVSDEELLEQAAQLNNRLAALSAPPGTNGKRGRNGKRSRNGKGA